MSLVVIVNRCLQNRQKPIRRTKNREYIDIELLWRSLSTAVIWLNYYRCSVKPFTINQSNFFVPEYCTYVLIFSSALAMKIINIKKYLLLNHFAL